MKILVCCIYLAFLAGCSAKTLRPSAQMTDGERLYRANCASCHSLRNPVDYSDEQWVTYVAKYGEKLNLSAEKQEKILHHLQASN